MPKIDILLVEDEEPSAVLITTLIKKFTTGFSVEYNVTVSETLGDAVSKVESSKNQFDIILLDLCLPDSNGVDTFKKIYKTCPEIPIVIMTGYSNPDWELEAINSGAQDFLFKNNITGNSILKSINKAIENKQLLEQISEDKKQINQILNAVMSDEVDGLVTYRDGKIEINKANSGKNRIVDFASIKNKLFDSYKETAKLSVTSRLDPLTGIPNRRLFDESFNQAVEIATLLNLKAALFVIDLDKFKKINDFYGHSVGDEILRAITDKISRVLRDNDFFARLGGDEFAIVLNNISDNKTVEATADRIIDEFRKQLKIGDKYIDASLSIGISVFPDNGTAPLELFNIADSYLYKAKKINGSSYVSSFSTNSVFENSGYEFQIHKNIISSDLNIDFIFTEYQPFFRLKDDKVAGVELFSRMTLSNATLPPKDFFPVIKKSNICAEFDVSVIKNFFNNLPVLKEKLCNRLPAFSINIFSSSLKDSQFVNLLISNLQHHKSLQIILETFESTIFNSKCDVTRENIKRLKDSGVLFSINNFGEGCTNFFKLKNVNVDSIKVSAEVIRGIGKDSNDEAFIKFIIQYAKSLNIKTYAESVETEEQKQFLLENGCDFYQGFLKCRPMEEQQLIEFLYRK